MANETVSIELLIENADGARTVGELKKAIKDLKSEALGVKEGSKEFIQLTQAAANAKDKMDDLNDAVNALNPGDKFAQFAKLGGTIASGFQAAQGAAALFGGESKELEKTLLKVQAATALSQGIQGLADMRKQFELLGNVIKANPILLITSVVIALGIALYELRDRVKILGVFFDAIGEKINAVKNFILSMTDAIGLTNTAADKAADELDKRFEKLIARGKEVDEQRARAKAYQEEQKKLDEEAEKKRKEAEEKKKTEDQKRTEEHLKNIQKQQESQQFETDLELQREKEKQDELLKIASEAQEKQAKVDAMDLQIKQYNLDQDKKISEAKKSIAQSTFNSLVSLGNVLIKDQEKLTKFNKASALVQLGIDTAKAISTTIASATAAAAATGPAAPFVAAGYIASGIAMVLANMATAKKLLGDSGSLSAPSLGGSGGLGTGSSQPRVIERSTSGVPETELDPQTGKVKSQSIKVYVTETDITDSQNKISKIQKAAILGG